MNGLEFPVTCARCGGSCSHVTSGRPTDLGTETRAVIRCDDCGQRWLLVVKLMLEHGVVCSPAAAAKARKAAQVA